MGALSAPWRSLRPRGLSITLLVFTVLAVFTLLTLSVNKLCFTTNFASQQTLLRNKLCFDKLCFNKLCFDKLCFATNFASQQTLLHNKQQTLLNSFSFFLFCFSNPPAAFSPKMKKSKLKKSKLKNETVPHCIADSVYIAGQVALQQGKWKHSFQRI